MHLCVLNSALIVVSVHVCLCVAIYKHRSLREDCRFSLANSTLRESLVWDASWCRESRAKGISISHPISGFMPFQKSFVCYYFLSYPVQLDIWSKIGWKRNTRKYVSAIALVTSVSVGKTDENVSMCTVRWDSDSHSNGRELFEISSEALVLRYSFFGA